MAKTQLGVLGEAPVVMIIGPVAYWWDTPEYKHWDLPQHWHYVKWRQRLNDALIESGYLTYRHWEAFKGTWNNKMQEVNNYVIDRSDFVINIKPDYAWSDGVEEEISYCTKIGKEIISAPPPDTEEEFSWEIKNILETLAQTP